MAINKIIYGNNTIIDLTSDTVVADKLATGYTAHDRSGAIITGTMQGSSWTKLAELTTNKINTTSTSATYYGAIQAGASAWDADKILYVKVRASSGKKTGYFYGTDNFLINTYAKNGSTARNPYFMRLIYSVSTSGNYDIQSYAYSTGLGVYAYNVDTNGEISIYHRYHTSGSKTINDTFKIEVYILNPPGGVSPLT